MSIIHNVDEGRSESQPKGMSAQFIDEAQCDPRAVESVREGKAQLELATRAVN